MNDIEVTLRYAVEAADAARGMDGVGDAARGMADDVDRAADEARRSLDGVGDAVDDTGGKASQLAGAFGDVAGGLGLIGLGGFSDELEAAAPALMLVAGTADIASVAMSTLSLSKIKDTAATVANKTAAVAASAATKAQAAAQWALNAAMSANPLGLILLAVAALIGLLIALGVDFDDVKRVIVAAGEVGAEAVGWVVDKVGDLVGWVGDKAPEAWNKAKEVTLRYFQLVTTPYRLLFNGIRDLVTLVRDRVPLAWAAFRNAGASALSTITAPLRRIVGWFIDVRDFARDKVPDGLASLRRTAINTFNAITAPIRTVRDLIKDVADWIDNLDLGIISDIGGAIGNVLGRSTGPEFGRPAPPAPPPPPSETVNLTVNGAIDPYATGRQIVSVLNTRRRSLGLGGIIAGGTV